MFRPSLLCVAVALATPAFGQATDTVDEGPVAPSPGVPLPKRANLRWRNAAVVGAGIAVVAAYGKSHWWQSGFGGGFKTVDEGFFGRGTASGGADKLGHMYSNYAGVRLLSPLFESVGNGPGEARRLAMWTTLGIFTGVEVADGLSHKWRFSPQDELMNAAGAALGLLLESRPELDEKIDFRIDYRPSNGSGFSPFGDYSGQRYLFVAKADGFGRLREHRLLRYLEVGVGYRARGFEEPGGERRRDLYVMVGLNLSRLLADGMYGGRMHSTPVQRGTDRLFELVQFPAAAYVGWRLD